MGEKCVSLLRDTGISTLDGGSGPVSQEETFVRLRVRADRRRLRTKGHREEAVPEGVRASGCRAQEGRSCRCSLCAEQGPGERGFRPILNVGEFLEDLHCK